MQAAGQVPGTVGQANPWTGREQAAAADRAAITAFRGMTPKQAARLLSFGVSPQEANTVDEPLALDVLERLTRDFGDRADAVATLLLAHRRIGSTDLLGDRLVRCIVQAAGADEERIEQLLDLARQDYRDVIVAGEYDGGMRQVRDLRASFLVDNPEKFWAGEVACIMASRGYRLTALETRSATVGPFEYTADYGEGRATFVGPLGEIAVEKKNRQWVVHGNRRDLAAHEMDHAFFDERVFRDALSGYLLSDVRVG
jgi:hypothetical protein